MRLHEISRFADNLLGVTDDCGVVGMLLGKFVEHRRRHFVFICERVVVNVGKISFVERQRSFIDGGLRLLQVGLRTLHDFFHRQIGREREAKLLSELLGTKTEIAV